MQSSCFHQNEHVSIPILSSQKKQNAEFKQNQMQMYRLNHDEDVESFTKKQIITTKPNNVMQQVCPISSRKKKKKNLIYLMNLHFPFRACNIGKIVGIHCMYNS